MGQRLKLGIAAALLPCAVGAAAEKQQLAAASDGRAAALRVDKHPGRVRGVFQGQHIRAVLEHFQEIAAVLVDDGKVGCDEDLFRLYPHLVRVDGIAFKAPGGGVLVDLQSGRDPRRQKQRMKLGLVFKLYGPGHVKGQGQTVPVSGLCPDALQGPQLLFQRFAVTGGIDKGGLCLHPAGIVRRQLAKMRNRGLIGLIIQPGGLLVVFTDQLVIDQAVLAGDLGGGVACHAAAYAVRLDQRIICAGPVQRAGAEKPRHSPADNQDVGFQILFQTGKGRQLRCVCPKRIDHFSSPGLVCEARRKI